MLNRIGEVPDMTETRDAEQRLVRRYRHAVGQCADNLGADLAKLQPPTDTSPFANDKATAKAVAVHRQRHPRLRLLNLNMQQCAHKIANLADHLRALQTLLTLDPPLVYAPSSTTRVAVEAAAGVHALLDDAITTDERTLRAASSLLDSLHHETHAVRQLPADRWPGVVTKLEERLTKLVTLAERAGLEVDRQPNGKPARIRWAGAPAFRGVPFEKASVLIERVFGEYPALYQMGSGVAHSMSWMLDDNARLAAEGPPAMVYGSDPYANGAATIAAIAAAEAVIVAFGRYMGYDPDSALVAYRRRREALDRFMNEYGTTRLTTLGHL
jgi:hypothetical protein